jgi:hypothetical protein
MDDLVKRLRVQADSAYISSMLEEAADRIEALEAKNRLLEQSQAAHALAGLGVDVVAAYNSGLAALKAGCKEERLRAEKAETRIETLETALREIRDWNNNQDRRILKIDAVIDAALGEKKDD